MPHAPRLALLLLLALCAPLAAAQETLTLDDLEEPRRGVDALWRVQVGPEEAGKARAVVFRNTPGNPFGLSVMDAAGETVFEKNGSRGIQTLPALEAGEYTFLVRFREGEFQVIEPAFGKNLNESVERAVKGGTDAFVVATGRHYNFTLEGAVEFEWWDMRGAPERAQGPLTRGVAAGIPYVLTVRGDEGAPYAIRLEETSAPPPAPTASSETPGAALPLVLAALVALALARRR